MVKLFVYCFFGELRKLFERTSTYFKVNHLLMTSVHNYIKDFLDLTGDFGQFRFVLLTGTNVDSGQSGLKSQLLLSLPIRFDVTNVITNGQE